MFNKVLFILCIFISSAHAEIYKWVDAEGKVHYGDKPVNNAKEMNVDVSKQGNIKINDQRESKRRKLLNVYDDDRKRENEEKSKRQKQKKKLAKGCAQSKDTLKRFIRASSLYDLDTDGNRVTISNVEREKRTLELRAKINKYCK